jgi:transcriptional regulator with XRE-family HTH domain
MKNKRVTAKKNSSTVPVDIADWLERFVPDTSEMRAIATEEAAKYQLAVALSEARKKAGLTQTQLAEKMGVPQSLISRWEHINHNHTLETLLKLCEATDAKLVIGLEVADHFLPVTAECCMILPEEACETLKERASRAKRTARSELTAMLMPQQPSLLHRSYASEMRLLPRQTEHSTPDPMNSMVKVNAA